MVRESLSNTHALMAELGYGSNYKVSFFLFQDVPNKLTIFTNYIKVNPCVKLCRRKNGWATMK